MSQQLLSTLIAAALVFVALPNGHALNVIRRRAGGSATWSSIPVHRKLDENEDNIITRNRKLRDSQNGAAQSMEEAADDKQDDIDEGYDQPDTDEEAFNRTGPEVSNPCFVSKSGKIMCLPHFMYVGLGHAGSTSLGTWLAKHPDIVWNIKSDQSEGNQGNETRYWAKSDGTAEEGPFDREEFADFFPVIPLGSTAKIGAKDPSITAAGAALSMPMLKMMPWLKIIIFLRA